MKAGIVYIILISSLLSYGQRDTNILIENDSLIYWNSKTKLEWKDFQGKPAKIISSNGLLATAVTFAPYLVEFSMNNEHEQFKIHCYFSKNRSWTKDTTQLYLLFHEQLHFDIAELFARKMNKEMHLLQMTDTSNYESYGIIFNKIYAERDEYEAKYDKETNYGKNYLIQEKWIKKVKKELEELEEYAIDYSKYLEQIE